MMSNIEVQTRHYEEAIMLRNKLLSQRNLYYFVFILVASIAAVFTHSKELVHSVLAEILARWAGVSPELIKEALPFRVIYCFLSFCVIFALTMLCHRGEVTQRMLRYLQRLETDIRQKAEIPTNGIAFTLFQPFDSYYYTLVSGVFVILLLSPIAFLMVSGVYSHLPAELPSISGLATWANQHFEFLVDVFTSVIVFLLLIAYLSRSLRYE